MNPLAVGAMLLLTALSQSPSRAPTVAAVPSERPWLVISDVHYMPFGRAGRSKTPSRAGADTNPALFASLLAELARTEPDPPVVIIAGDFLGHGFPVAKAAATMAYLARRFDRAFPRAQFVIVLGNNDSACGDYEQTADSAFLRDTARAWRPLVDRAGAAPDFVRSFSHTGGYVARLPRPGLRAVVVDDVYDALRYRDACGTGDPAAMSLGYLDRTLARAPRDERTWLVTHVPPGIDAFSTAHLAHRLVVVPFMRPGARERLVGLIGRRSDGVALVVTGHTHHFSFRVSRTNDARGGVPILVAPSVSPIFRNAPSFLTLDVARDGTVRDVVETSYAGGRWRRIGSLADRGVAAFTAADLLAYRDRLARGTASRTAFATLYAGGAASEIDDRNWPIYRCAITAFSASEMRACTNAGGIGLVTGRAFAFLVVFGAIAIAIAIACAVAAIAAFRR